MSYAAANDSSDSSFHPSLWLQRRAMALLILKDFGIERVLDLGCGEGALLQVLLNGQFSKLAGLDVDAQCLAEAAINCRPSRHDLTYLRDSPCRLDLYLGSLAHGVDQRCLGFQAIAALEV